MRKGWVSNSRWAVIQDTVPIPCVDVLLIKTVRARISAVGLIYRHTPEGPGWCLIGGRLLLNEPFRVAVARHVRETLGPRVRCILSKMPEPVLVAEYFSLKRKRSLFDARKHAVAIVFQARVKGVIKPRGEALDFRWFDIDRLPKPSAFGFGQKKVVSKCIQHFVLT
jgi:ADP-ribose pyrophosphatase YjhB (NUDIX family)